MKLHDIKEVAYNLCCKTLHCECQELQLLLFCPEKDHMKPIPFIFQHSYEVCHLEVNYLLKSETVKYFPGPK